MSTCSRMLIGTMAAAVLTLSVGCDKNKEDTGASTTGDNPAAAATIELSDDDVPVAEDYIEEATKEIDGNNLNAKLDDIEKEIGSQ